MVSIFVTVCVSVFVAQTQVEGFKVTVTVTVLGCCCLHGSTIVTVVGTHDFVGCIGSVGSATEK